jgi:hypothetical protein
VVERQNAEPTTSDPAPEEEIRIEVDRPKKAKKRGFVGGRRGFINNW